MKRKITDLGENEVIHTPSVEEAIEIDLMSAISLGEDVMRKAFKRFGKNLCLDDYGYQDISYYINKGHAILPASDFLPTEFYKTVEPKVGQVWEWSKKTTKYHIKGKKYNVTSIDAHGNGSCNIALTHELDGPHWMDEKWLLENFRFVSEPADKLKMEEEQMSERKAASFKFYDQLPEPLRTQAKDNFDEGFNDIIPDTLTSAIHWGWSWQKSKHGDHNLWASVETDIEKGKYNPSENEPKQSNVDPAISFEPLEATNTAQPTMIVQSTNYVDPKLIDLYKASDPKHRELMRGMFDVEFPKEKEYVRVGEILFVAGQESNDGAWTISFKNCTPEISGNEIRFVKNP